VFDTNASGVIQETSVSGPAGDLASYAGAPETSTGTSYRYYNGHGDLAADADQAGNRANAYTYDSFGAALQTPAANSTEERWTARWDKRLDTSSALIEMGVRAYDPVLGRFTSVDPIEGGSLNTYDYADQDPVNTYDLDGRRADYDGERRPLTQAELGRLERRWRNLMRWAQMERVLRALRRDRAWCLKHNCQGIEDALVLLGIGEGLTFSAEARRHCKTDMCRYALRLGVDIPLLFLGGCYLNKRMSRSHRSSCGRSRLNR